ncbi:GAF domain-containing protein [Pedobacter westerhofensis]|uniref:GAF domain-containing protein n=1 Tax=Pedobacter westerhofensis TaxID=425512 RepID=A0A521AD45_9SPHI|nr:GAF domain-containing protein [Pedobacter westerhofensis]SMO32725.1 GAF domain-containing protein [Pedobacter westerhofensis]
MPDSALKGYDTVNRFLKMDISKEAELQQIVELAANICNAPIALITFMDDKTQHIKFKVGTNVGEVPSQDTFCQYTVAQKEFLIIPDASVDERVMNNPYVVQNPHVRFYAGSPLTTHDDDNIGTLCVYDTQPRILTAMQEKMLQRLARQVTRLLEFDASLQLLKEQYEYSLIQQTKLRSFFESTSSCHLLLDTQLRVISFNSAMSNALMDRYQLPIVEGMEVTDYVESSFMDEFIHNCKTALSGEAVSKETVINSLQGNVPWQLTYEPAFDSAGIIIGVTYSATDISQTAKHEKTIMEQGESFRQIDLILSELNQPMQMVKSAMAGIKDQGYPVGVIEFELLESVCEELWEKRSVSSLADKEVIKVTDAIVKN